MSGARQRRVAVAGNPNVGKTSLFNDLTGSRYLVGNYPGVTVERREGEVTARLGPSCPLRVVDLPGTYSLTVCAEDEAVALRALTGVDGEPPDAVLLVVDASNLARNLYLALQLRELGIPMVVALNMADVAERAGLAVDVDALADELGVPVVATVARTGRGTREVVAALCDLPGELEPRLVPAAEGSMLADVLGRLEALVSRGRARWLLACHAAGTAEVVGATPEELALLREIGDEACEAATTELIVRRYAEVDRIVAHVGHAEPIRDRAPVMTRSHRADRILTHRVAGLVVFVGVMALVFQSIFSWAEPIMDAIEGAMGWLSTHVADVLGPGVFTDLVTEGIIAGVGNVLVFLPQIALLFLFIGLLEDSGYMARAAFLMDRLMKRVGLHGRAFVPLLSGYACAIPAILGTRTIEGFRDRMVATLMIPFMSCSARLPIYALVIYTVFAADRVVFGPFTERGLVLLSMYGLSTFSALALGWLYKRTILRGPTPPLVLELPPYRLPRLRNTLLVVYDRSMDFVRNAGTIILAFTVVLWALLSFPRVDPETLGPDEAPIVHSVGGRLGKAFEPVMEPIGQDWRIGVGVLGSFVAREVLVSTLALVYGMEDADEDDPVSLREAIRSEVDPATGEPRFTRLRGVALMVFFVYACQCMSTLAVVRRETRGWRWPAFMFLSMTAIAYVMALIVYQGGRALGLG